MGKQLQITVDDGPEPVRSALSPILAELERRRLIAAFFNKGNEVKSSPEATRAIQNKGHVLGNHSWDHLEPNTSKYTDAEILDQFRRTHEEVKTATGVEMQHWRAPRLEQVSRLAGLLVGRGKLYTLSHCDMNADSKDSQGVTAAAGMLEAIRAELAKQSARTTFRLLFHVKPTTAAALRAVLDGLEADGHKLVNFSQAS